MTDAADPEPRQRVVRSRSGRRAKLTPAPGTTAEPVAADELAEAAPPAGDGATRGPNDEQLKRDVPPHY